MALLTCVIPAYNEERVAETVNGLQSVLKGVVGFEIIVVDDGSAKPVELKGVTVIRHHVNMGYGAALKTGMLRAKGDRILIIDADGTYPVEDVPKLLDDDYDMVVGARTKVDAKIELYRRPAKWFLGRLANYLARTSIPDLNSGMRVFRREVAMKYLHLYPRGFSFTTTITLAMLCDDYSVKYVPVDYNVRRGKSKIRPLKDGLNFIAIILRTILYFNPLRIFLPISMAIIAAGLLVFAYTSIVLGRVMDITVVTLILSGVQVALFGMLAELIVKRAQ
ncbi:MAG: glycosyltransferase family 2 protein [Candidatus Altiarchaeota archaeon]